MSEIVTVTVAQGKLRGREATTKSGVTYYSFQGIPYAKPPVGPLRFKAPQPVDSWEGTRDALIEGPVCAQMDLLKKEFKGEEDCLYLNVYTPKVQPSITDNVKNTVVNEELNSSSRETRLKENKRLRLNSRSPCASKENKNTSQLPGTGDFLRAVMVWIHGGGFAIGDGNAWMYGPDYLVAEDVVLVTMNYRLGPLGFICLEDSVVPGNNGLKDQVMALRWVQQNIAQFGGDPGNVTIGGSGAGAISVQLHILSPMSRGLFHRAIISSDSAIRPVYGEDASTARCKAFRLGEALGCKTSESKKLIEFLMKVPAYEFVDIIDRTLNEEEKHPVPVFFLPVVEKGMQTEEVFLSERPIDIIKQGTFTQVPIITGVTSREGLFIMADFVANPSWYCSLSDNFESMLMSYFRLKKGNENTQEIARKVKKFYFGYQRISCETLPQLVDFYGDIFCNLWTYRNARELQANSEYPVYFYTFSYVGNFGDSPGLFTFEQVKGASHGSDLAYLFETFFHKDHYDHPQHESMKMCSKMLKMWINFAKTGNPTPEEDPLLGVTWKPITEKEFNYLNIDKKLSLQKDLLKERMDFWEEIMS